MSGLTSLPYSIGRLASVAAVTVALVSAGAAPVFAAKTANGPEHETVSVSGHGEASTVPDVAVLSASVEVTETTATQALASQNAAAAAMLDATKKQGVADQDIQTQGLTLVPIYDYETDSQKPSGYQAGQSFFIKVRDISKAGSVIKAAMGAAGDAGRINGVSFDVENHSALDKKARGNAFKDARLKAEQYAGLSGRTLGRLLTVDETDSGGSQLPPMERAGMHSDVPLAPGKVHRSVLVNLTYELN